MKIISLFNILIIVFLRFLGIDSQTCGRSSVREGNDCTYDREVEYGCCLLETYSLYFETKNCISLSMSDQETLTYINQDNSLKIKLDCGDKFGDEKKVKIKNINLISNAIDYPNDFNPFSKYLRKNPNYIPPNNSTTNLSINIIPDETNNPEPIPVDDGVTFNVDSVYTNKLYYDRFYSNIKLTGILNDYEDKKLKTILPPPLNETYYEYKKIPISELNIPPIERCSSNADEECLQLGFKSDTCCLMRKYKRDGKVLGDLINQECFSSKTSFSGEYSYDNHEFSILITCGYSD